MIKKTENAFNTLIEKYTWPNISNKYKYLYEKFN